MTLNPKPASIVAAAILVLAVGCSSPSKPAIQTADQPVTPTVPVLPPDLPWWNEKIFYEVFVRSFYDSNGDGVGDLRGLIQKLDYLNDGDPNTTTDLGVTGLWLMPVMESPSYHGYDVTDYEKIQPAYGTNDDFKELVQQAHERGMAVIVDLPLNHTSDQHPWFIDAQQPGSEHADWYIWSEADPQYLGPWNERVWHPLDGRYYYGIFASTMPDLNYRNPQVTSAMQDISRFWLADMGVDGFRLDAARHLIEDGQDQVSTPNTHAWLDGYHSFVKSVRPDSLIVGEVWSTTMEVSSYIGDQQLDLAFEFDLASAMVSAVKSGDSSYLKATQQQVLNSYPPGQYAAFLTNHDQERVMSELGGDERKAQVAAVLLLTNPGVPFIYYGEEIGLSGGKPDERIRTPLPWTARPISAGFTTGTPWEDLSPGFETLNIETETIDPASLLNTYRRLIQIRQDHDSLRTGQMLMMDSSARSVYAYSRASADETLLVLFNLSDEPEADYALTLDQSPLKSGSKASWIFGSGNLADPVVSSSGGFVDYQPLGELTPLSTVIIKLAP